MIEPCPHPQQQGRVMSSADGTIDRQWVTWCPKCMHAWTDDRREWIEDVTLPWPAQLVPVD